DSEITANALKMLLNEAFSKRTDIKFDGFNINTCREMISLLDEETQDTMQVPDSSETFWNTEADISDTVRRWPSMNQKVGPHRHQICQCFDLGLLSLQNYEK
ncbi:CAPN8 isoform 8, partial [Pongo abelii]